jgi:high affinity cGMP-specific 3',5'-cyclic phosphodiesterase 9
MTQIDYLAFILAALAHDYKHDGKNNSYHLNAQTYLAVRYNDSAILESFHIAQLYKLLESEKNQILSTLSTQEKKIVRKRIVECILATDMARHGELTSGLKSLFEAK